VAAVKLAPEIMLIAQKFAYLADHLSTTSTNRGLKRGNILPLQPLYRLSVPRESSGAVCRAVAL
jgi:hypothetical protein